MYCFCVFSPKIVAHLSAPVQDKPAGPVAMSQNSFVRFSFKEGGEKDVSYRVTVRWMLELQQIDKFEKVL